MPVESAALDEPEPPHRARRRSAAGRRGVVASADAGEEGDGGVEVGDVHELPAARPLAREEGEQDPGEPVHGPPPPPRSRR